MSFETRITRWPDAFDGDRADQTAKEFADLAAPVRDVLSGAAGCSPYLDGLLKSQADWLRRSIDAPEQAIAQACATARMTPLADLSEVLRVQKQRVALLTALADLGGVWTLEQVTGFLTDYADAAVSACVRELVAAQVTAGNLPPQDNPDDAAGMVVLAMGKMGARELNYSSDIDLICLFDETRYDPDDYHRVRATFIKVTRLMTALLSDRRTGGYVFRTDLRLRPDASVTPVCLSIETAERYYESVGRTWERAAYIKARVCAGDLSAGARFLRAMQPFVWRKHLDFAAIEDAHNMRLRIRDHKGLHGPLEPFGHDLKLGQGGIREIEFFTQTRQLIAGGRNPDLRTSGTVAGLAALAQADWISDAQSKQLQDAYRAHREVEHRLQMIADAQTHQIPNTREGFARIASLMGRDATALHAEIGDRLAQVDALTDPFFAPQPPDIETVPEWGQDITDRWPTYPALRTARATEIFNRLKPIILARLHEAPKPDEALAQFDRFLSGLPAGVQVFSLFDANPHLTQLIVDICAVSPALSDYLSRNAGVFDSVVAGSFFSDWPGADGLRADLARTLDEAVDYEAKLLTARRWAKEWHFRIGVHYLRGLIDHTDAGRQYADLAQAVICALWPVVVAEFATKHGTIEGRGAAVLAMGSFGSGRMHAQSDLDIIVVFDAPEDGQTDATSDGARPLSARPYFARLTQALVTALSAPMAEGRLYQVDMRLRPSGRQGPVATSFSAFRDYQRTQAWTWEHLAMTRARVLAGEAGLASEIEAFRSALIADAAHKPALEQDVAEMRLRIDDAKKAIGPLEPKLGPGRLQDTELFAQLMALRSGSATRDPAEQLRTGCDIGRLSEPDLAVLTEALAFWQAMQTALRFLTVDAGQISALAAGSLRLLLREMGHQKPDTLAKAIDLHAQRASDIIGRQLNGGPDEA